MCNVEIIFKGEREERRPSRVGISMMILKRRSSIQQDEGPENLLKFHLTPMKIVRVNYFN